MGNVKECPQGIGKGMHCPNTGHGKTHPCQIAPFHHFFTIGVMAPIEDGPPQIGGNQFNGPEGNGCTQEMGLEGSKRLDGMGQGIHPRIGSRLRRESQGKLGVQNGGVGIEIGTIDSTFGLCVSHGENRGEGSFASRTCCGGDHDGGQARVFYEAETNVIHRLSLIGSQHGDGFGHIHGASTANPYHALYIILFCQFCPGICK